MWRRTEQLAHNVKVHTLPLPGGGEQRAEQSGWVVVLPAPLGRAREQFSWECARHTIHGRKPSADASPSLLSFWRTANRRVSLPSDGVWGWVVTPGIPWQQDVGDAPHEVRGIGAALRLGRHFLREQPPLESGSPRRDIRTASLRRLGAGKARARGFCAGIPTARAGTRVTIRGQCPRTCALVL